MQQLILRNKKTGQRAKTFTVTFDNSGQPPIIHTENPLPPRWLETALRFWVNLRQSKPAPTGRRLRLQSQHTIDQPHIHARPLTGPEDWLTKRGLPNASAIMPTRAPEFNADVKTPLAQSAVAAGIVTTGAMAAASAASYFLSYPIDAYINSVIISGLLGIATFGQQWFAITKKNRSTLWALEMLLQTDIDGDQAIGDPIKPRAIPINRGEDTDYMPMPDAPGGLLPAEWRQVAIAVLVKGANISRRGISDASTLSQAKATEAVNALAGYTDENHKPTGSGYDFLIHYLPDHLNPTLPHPAE